MRRRDFLSIIGGAAAGWPLAARAQQTTMPRIGVLLVAGPEIMGPFPQALRDLGYFEGKNIQIEMRSAEGEANRLPGLAAELVRSKIDIIVASQTPAIVAARNATSDIPIIMAPAGDPVALGLVASLARPGGNITGLSAAGPEVAAKSLELIREIVPAARRVAALGNANDPFVRPFLEQIEKGAPMVRLEIQPIMVRDSDELERAFAAMAQERADAVVIQGSLPVKSTLELALKYHLPAFASQKSVAQAGAVVSYSADFAERGHKIAGYVDNILKGAKPAELPVQQPTKYELVINLKSAKALGLTIPESVLVRADEVIE
ncbi:MAG TPA: ABC transporter substrate-binding protein [Xanthobacteraceae bacterium]